MGNQAIHAVVLLVDLVTVLLLFRNFIPNVLPLNLCTVPSSGYQASSSQAFLEGVKSALSTLTLRADEESEYVNNPMGLHFRPLGNVAYLMTSLDTPRSTIQTLQRAILHSLP